MITVMFHGEKAVSIKVFLRRNKRQWYSINMLKMFKPSLFHNMLNNNELHACICKLLEPNFHFFFAKIDKM